MKKPPADVKRRAAGEDAGEVAMPLEPIESLLEALKPHGMTRRSSDQIKTLVGPLNRFQDRRVKTDVIGHWLEIPEAFEKKLFDNNPIDYSIMSYHCEQNREIMVAIGMSDRTCPCRMENHLIESHVLRPDELVNLHVFLPIKKLGNLLYQLDLERSDLPVDSVVFELGLFSRLEGSKRVDFIGKCKVYFGRPSNKMTLWIDLTGLKR